MFIELLAQILLKHVVTMEAALNASQLNTGYAATPTENLRRALLDPLDDAWVSVLKVLPSSALVFHGVCARVYVCTLKRCASLALMPCHDWRAWCRLESLIALKEKRQRGIISCASLRQKLGFDDKAVCDRYFCSLYGVALCLRGNGNVMRRAGCGDNPNSREHEVIGATGPKGRAPQPGDALGTVALWTDRGPRCSPHLPKSARGGRASATRNKRTCQGTEGQE